jgi:hypothetical protein
MVLARYKPDLGKKDRVMKTFIIVVTVALAFGGCKSTKTSEGTPQLRSEREYAERSEVVAQDLYKSGQVASIEAARAQASATSNQEWAAAAKAARQRRGQEKITKDLDKVKREGE